jgi:hypothetical protein
MGNRTNKSTSPYHPPSNPPPPPKEKSQTAFPDYSKRGDVIIVEDDGEPD